MLMWSGERGIMWAIELEKEEMIGELTQDMIDSKAS